LEIGSLERILLLRKGKRKEEMGMHERILCRFQNTLEKNVKAEAL
jgi:hypothetical protein